MGGKPPLLNEPRYQGARRSCSPVAMQIYGKAVTKPGFHWVERTKGHDGKTSVFSCFSWHLWLVLEDQVDGNLFAEDLSKCFSRRLRPINIRKNRPYFTKWDVQLEMEVLPAIGLPFDFASWSLPSLNTMRATNCQETFKPVMVLWVSFRRSFMSLQEPWYVSMVCQVNKWIWSLQPRCQPETNQTWDLSDSRDWCPQAELMSLGGSATICHHNWPNKINRSTNSCAQNTN